MRKFLSILLILLIVSGSICIPVYAAGNSRWTVGYEKKIFKDVSYKIPDLDTYFVPQGLCSVTTEIILHKDVVVGMEYHLITAYDYKEKKDSRIYIMNPYGYREKTVSIKDSIGKHVGGITEYKGKIWVVSTKVIYVIEKKDLFDGDSIVTPDTIETLPINNVKLKGNYSFCTTSNDGQYLWIGTYKEEGEAYANAFSYDDKTKELKHCATMKIPKRAQGMCFDSNNNVYISTAPFSISSKIYKYKIDKIEEPKHNEVRRYGGNYRTFITKQIDTIRAPIGIEEIFCNRDDNVWAIFESSSKAYKWMKWIGYPENRVVLIDM